jgi:uncharacterized protein (DUF427 family)
MAQPQRIAPGPGQESVWDYPRPPRVEATSAHIQVIIGGVVVADTRRAQRVLETSHPPVYYIPPEDVRMEYFSANRHASFCEFKGEAAYYTANVMGIVVPSVAWFYPQPTPAFAAIAGYLAFYPSRVERALVDDEPVAAQPGDFYGGWITRAIVGPFKGGAGTMGW